MDRNFRISDAKRNAAHGQFLSLLRSARSRSVILADSARSPCAQAATARRSESSFACRTNNAEKTKRAVKNRFRAVFFIKIPSRIGFSSPDFMKLFVCSERRSAFCNFCLFCRSVSVDKSEQMSYTHAVRIDIFHRINTDRNC